MIRTAFFSLVALTIILAGCKKKAQVDNHALLLDSLQQSYAQLQQQLDSSWKVMIADDDEKLFNIKRLLDEVSYTNVYNDKQLNMLMEHHEAVRSSRYDQSSMADSRQIDHYDSLTRNLISDAVEFARHHPQYDNYPLMAELVTDIMEADHRVLMMRVKYDHVAFEINDFLRANANHMDQIDPSAQDVAVFALMEEEELQ